MNNEKITVLLTGAGAPGMPGILRCLSFHRDELRLVGVDMDANAPSRKDFDAFYVIPAAKEEGFIPALLDVCEQEKVKLLVPGVTRELRKVALARAVFEDIETKVAVLDPERLEIVNNKGKLLSAMKEVGMETADFCLADNLEQLADAFDRLGYPERAVCVKAVEGNGSRAVRMVDAKVSKSRMFFEDKPNGMYISRHDLWETLSETSVFPKQILVMQYLPGDEYSVDIVAREGTIQAAVARCGMQVVSSNQTMSRVLPAPEVISICEAVVRRFGLSGNIGFDLKCDESGKPYVLEINPRLTGGIVTCLAAGANMPWLGIQSWLGVPVRQPKLRYGVTMQRYWNERFYDETGNRMEITTG